MNTRTRDKDALFVAIKLNDIDLLKAVLKKDINLEDNRFGYFPLTMAAKKGYWRCVRLIAKHPNKKNQYDLDKALFEAVMANKLVTVTALLKAGACPNRQFDSSSMNYEEWASIYEAIDNNNSKIIGLLLYYGARLEDRAFYYANDFHREMRIHPGCDVLEYVEQKTTRKQCFKLGWEEFEKLKNRDEQIQQEKDIIFVIAQGLRQRESYIVRIPLEIITNILKLAGNKFHQNVANIYNKLNYISFNFVLNEYQPNFFSNRHSKSVVAKISDGITQNPVDFYALFNLVEKYLNKYLSEKKLTLDEAAEKSSLITLLKKYQIADSAQVNLNLPQKSLALKK